MEFLDSKNPNLEGEEVKSMPSRKDRWREGDEEGDGGGARKGGEKVQKKQVRISQSQTVRIVCVCVCVYAHHVVVVGEEYI